MNPKPIQIVTILVIFLLLFVIKTSGQIVRAGVKAGFQMSWLRYDDPSHKELVKHVYPMPGYNIGAVFSFKVRNRYFLHTEYLFSTKGRVLRGRRDPDLHDKATYHYIDVPILYTMHFKGKLGGEKQFKWYFGGGPILSYWLGGKGVLVSGDLLENRIDEMKYKIKFGTRDGHAHPDIIYINDANRLQLGLTIGAGFMLEPNEKNKIVFDIRYEYGNTRLGKKSFADYQIPADFDDSVKARNQGVRISIMYLMEYSTSKKDRNKGKSTIKAE